MMHSTATDPKRSSRSNVSRACPTFFWALRSAARRGGRDSYRAAGWALAGAIPSCLSDFDDEDVLALRELLDDPATEDQCFLKWLVRYLPNCMALVPPKRRETFMKGFMERVDRDGLEV